MTPGSSVFPITHYLFWLRHPECYLGISQSMHEELQMLQYDFFLLLQVPDVHDRLMQDVGLVHFGP